MRRNMKARLAVAAAAVMMVVSSMSALAAEPTAVAVKDDYKSHKVAVFGTALALVKQDGSVEITPIGKTGMIDVMVDGVITKGAYACTIEDNS